MTETRQRKPDYLLLAAVGTLVLLGLVMVYSASFMRAYADTGDQLYYTWRQMNAAVVGTVALLAAHRIDYRVWRRFSVHLMAGTLFLLALTLILPASMTEANGARSWIRIGAFSVQPSEIAKLTMVIYFADWLSRRGEKLTNVTYGLAPFALMLGVVCGLVMLGRDLGTTIVLVVIAGMVYFAAGANLLHIIGAAIMAGSAFWGLINIAAYRQERIAAWIDPFAHYQGAGYQPVHALYALGSGGLFGVGIGQARQKFFWLPEAHTDAIFAIIGEEFGLIGTLFVVTCFLVIAYRGMRIAGRSSDPFAALLATGITCWLVFQALINIAVVTTLIPFTGLTLPFISYGGTSLAACMAAAGILLNISRHTGATSPGVSYETVTRSGRSESFARLAGWWRNRGPRLSGVGRRRGAQRAWGAIRRR
ncbi:putative lipid II flippase FtsW [Roseiflexus castenholzii]|uniref:putative lipid II flippase FtsW n=1 Tax=Roseiflexus castenholzii TaxID=120962 RepID=UPI003C7A2CF4